MSGVKEVFGGGAFWTDGQGLAEPATYQKLLEILEKHGVKNIDTARIYGDSEQVIGNSDAPKRFTIDTKLRGGFGEGASKASIQADLEKSRSLLKTDVDILYIHGPDAKTPLEETLEAVNEVYKTGFFKRFGLSNFVAEDVQKAYDIATKNGWIVPTVYQGNYNAAARRQEQLLIPTLRKLNISLYSYSPIAGGFLAKRREQVENGKGRWDPTTQFGKIYHDLYNKPTLLDALDEWHAIAEEEGTSASGLAYRWVKYNSALKPELGDAMIIGTSSLEQLEDALTSTKKGPLSEKAVKRIDEFWAKIKDESPLDNFNK